MGLKTKKQQLKEEVRVYQVAKKELEPLLEVYLPWRERKKFKLSIKNIVLDIIEAKLQSSAKLSLTDIFLKELPYYMGYGMPRKKVNEFQLISNDGAMDINAFGRQLMVFIENHPFYVTHNHSSIKKRNATHIKQYTVEFGQFRISIDISITKP